MSLTDPLLDQIMKAIWDGDDDSDAYSVRKTDGWIDPAVELPKVGERVWILLSDDLESTSGSKAGTAEITHAVSYPWIIPVDGKDWYVRYWRRTQ